MRRQASVPPDGARRTARSRRFDGRTRVLVARAAVKTAHEKLFTVELQRYTEFELLCGWAPLRRRWLLWCCLGCCLLLGSLQHAEAGRAHRYACLGVLSELVSLRAHDRPLLHPSDSTIARAANTCEAATQDRPRSFYLFNIFSGPYTVRMLLLPAHACATLHECACRYMRSRPTHPYSLHRLQRGGTPRAVQMVL